MTLNPKASYWTLFCPKYCAESRAGRRTRRKGSSASRWRRNMATSSGSAGRQLQGITPEALELIERASLRVEQVDHEIDVVQENPSASGQPLRVMRGKSGLV